MKTKIAICLILISVLAACSGKTSESNSPSGSSQKLPSGREIVVTGINEMKLQNGQTGLIFNYQTKIPMENRDELRSEVEEIWSTFRYDVEKAKADAGVIRATHMEDGGLFIKNGKGHGFVYEKDAEGKWHLDEDKK